MKYLRKRMVTFIGLISMLSFFTNPVIGSAKVISTNASYFTEQEKDNMKEMLTELGVDSITQVKLIQKLQNGEMWDSMDEKQLEKIPVGYFNVSPEEPIKRYVFPDGSVIQNELDIISVEKVKVTPRDISGGNHSSGSGYHTVTKARIHQSGNNVGIEFYANYTLVDGGYDKITRVYDPAVKVAYGSANTPELKIIRQTENSNGVAEAKLTVQVNYGIVYPESETRWLKLYVGNDKAWTEFR